jgi:hypothetical protein
MHLAHGAERVLHCARFDWVLEGGQSPIMVSLSKDLEDQHKAIPVSKIGFNIFHHA